MPKITMIAAVGPAGELGYKGELIYKSNDDLRFFCKETKRIGAVLMGRKTWESLPPARRPLKDRVCYVLTRYAGTADRIRDAGGTPIYMSPNQFNLGPASEWTAELLQQHPGIGSHDELAVIGGAEIYRMFLPSAARILLTEYTEPAVNVDTWWRDWPLPPDRWWRTEVGTVRSANRTERLATIYEYEPKVVQAEPPKPPTRLLPPEIRIEVTEGGFRMAPEKTVVFATVRFCGQVFALNERIVIEVPAGFKEEAWSQLIHNAVRTAALKHLDITYDVTI
jgi:dihydrofolate reductase